LIEKSLEKIRLEKKYNNKIMAFDCSPKFSLITSEIEFHSLSESRNFKANMKEITDVKRCKNQNLAN